MSEPGVHPAGPGEVTDCREHRVRARDGWVLSVRDYPAEGQAPERARGIVIAGHAMMADSRTLVHPGRDHLVAHLRASGLRVLVPDLRGHGRSGPLAAEGGAWRYDDLVDDVGALVGLAGQLEPEAPVALLGHSLFGHASLAWLGRHAGTRAVRPVAAAVALATEVWLRRFEPRRRRWWIKRALFGASVGVTSVVGYVPARRLRMGSADESAGYWFDFRRFVRTNRWSAADGFDYLAATARIRVPVLHVLSEGDHLYAAPRSAAALSEAITRRHLVVLGRSDAPGPLAGLRPTHMGIVTDPQSAPCWRWVAQWLDRQLSREA